ncbi:hypothetical protein ACFRJ9_02635 [Paenarthrobacter sp. NPDC056912]|uniref:hypothetical protein n=1 Tax=Paenarthrobacter sp. NPDC056912 TaxID=3345965 RepID=UPI00366EF01E
MKRHYRGVLHIALAAILCLTLASCDNIANPDMGQRDSTAQAVLDAVRGGDTDKLLDLSATDMQAREEAAEILVAQAEALDGRVNLSWTERHSPDHQEATATDADGDSISFGLSWLQAEWKLILGEAGPPLSPAASSSPS